MNTRDYAKATMDLAGSILCPRAQPTRRMRDLRFLFLSILLAILFSAAFGAALVLLNKQGRI
jgi:hypothetical protein